MINYLPFEERRPDTQYRDRLALILDAGMGAKSMHAEESITYLAPPPLRYDLQNGIPLITERGLPSWRSAVAELLGFAVHGYRTLEELVAFGMNEKFWIDFVTKEKCADFGLEEGDLGDGSYGPGFVREFYDPDTRYWKTVNQIENVVLQIKKYPHARTHFIDPWIPQYTVPGPNNDRRVVVAPCHGWMLFRVLENRLHLTMVQRSGDMPIGVPHNIIQYAALLLVIGHVLDMEVGMYCHQFIDAHLYVNQIDVVNELLSREPRPFPRLDLEPDTPKDLFAIRPEHFILTEYKPHESIKGIPVAI